MLQIHQKIEQARLSAGLTQDEIAEKLGIKRSTYQYWEKKDPSIDKVKQVAKVLGLGEDYFFGQNDENINMDKPKKQSESYNDIEIAIKNLTEADLINARNIERLISLLEDRLKYSPFPEPGTPGTETLTRKREVNK